MPKPSAFFSLGLALLSLTVEAGPQAHRLDPAGTPPVIDGRLDEPAWARAPVQDRFVQFLPEDKKPAPWRTTVQLLLSGDALVIGIRAFDPEPERIRAPLARRDRVARDQDFVSVVIDPVGLRRSAQFARISAAGVIADGMFTAEDDVEDFAPDFDVEAAVQRLPDGWSAELRWPLAALRYPYSAALPWRMMVTRNIPREDSVLVVSAPALTKEALSFIAELEPIEGMDDLVERVRERTFVQVRPELTVRKGSGGKAEASLGAELKWRPRADWVIDATLNPDFSQVELDAPQLAGNTRFALSVPEKRPFFLESTDIVGGSQAEGADENRGLAAFYSRAITDPAFGLRATWRGASAEATALSLRDDGGGVVLRAGAYGTAMHAQSQRSQASYARGRMQVFDTFGLGLLASSREYEDGRYNRVVGTDFAGRLGETDQLRGHLLASSTTAGFDADGRAQLAPRESGRRLWLGWQRRNEDWHNAVNFEQVDPGFANDNGFVSQTGYRRLDAMFIRRLPGRTLAPLGEWSRFEVHEWELDLRLRQTETLRDPRLGVVQAGELIERQVRPGFWFAAARNTGVWGHLGLDSQRAHAGGRLHAPRTLVLGFETNPNAGFTFLMAELAWGRRLDVDADRLGLGANLNLEAKFRMPLPAGMGLELEQRLGQGFVRDASGQRRAFSDRHAQTLAVLHFNAQHSLRTIAQQTHYRRLAEALLAAADERGRDVSVVYQHRVGLSRIASLGFSRSRVPVEEGGGNRSELFAKLVLAWPR